jgi:gas vesicle protein
MSKKSDKVGKDLSATANAEVLTMCGQRSSIAWGIFSGILFGTVVGAAVGIFLRPKDELTELSQEWLEELKDVTDQVSGTVRHKVKDLVSKRHDQNEHYEEYPEPFV